MLGFGCFLLLFTLVQNLWLRLFGSVGVPWLIWALDREIVRLHQRPHIILNPEGITSSNFDNRINSGAKQLLWSDIAAISTDHLQLKFSLNKKMPIGIFRRKTSTTMLSLGGMDAAEKTAMLRAIDRYRDKLSAAPASSLTEQAEHEQQFNDQLEQLSPVPWATYGLIALNIAVWLATLYLGGGIQGSPADKLLQWGGNAASEVQKGQWWRLLSATFLHSGLLHVAMNMLGLYAAGVTLERIYGARQFLLVYFASGLIGSALSLSWTAQGSVSVGASGAVFGILGALVVAVLKHKDKLPRRFSSRITGLGVYVVYALIQGFSESGIDNAAHIGGLLGGCLLALILPERFDLERFRRLQLSRDLAALGIVILGVIGLVAAAPTATLDQRRLFASEALMQKVFKDFDANMKALQQEEEDVKAGKISARQADERSRTVFAPRFHQTTADLSQVILRPGDPRENLLRDTRRLAELLTEILAMNSTFAAGSDTPIPANPQRWRQIEKEIPVITARLQQETAKLKQLAARKGRS